MRTCLRGCCFAQRLQDACGARCRQGWSAARHALDNDNDWLQRPTLPVGRQGPSCTSCSSFPSLGLCLDLDDKPSNEQFGRAHTELLTIRRCKPCRPSQSTPSFACPSTQQPLPAGVAGSRRGSTCCARAGWTPRWRLWLGRRGAYRRRGMSPYRSWAGVCEAEAEEEEEEEEEEGRASYGRRRACLELQHEAEYSG